MLARIPARALARLRSGTADAMHTVRHQPGRAAQASAEFLARWALRLGLPLAGAAAMLHLFPYHASAAGVHFRVQATLFTRSGLTADTTFGNWEFGHVDGLPVGVHLSPENVDVVRLTSAATKNPQAFVSKLRTDFLDQLPQILAWLVGTALIGVVIGLLIAVTVNLAVRYLRRRPHQPGEWRRRGIQAAAAVAVLAAIAGYGAASFNPHWARQSRLTGTLGALQLFPGQLRQYYQQQATAFDVLSGISVIQSQLQQRIDQKPNSPVSTFNIMFISDMHLASTYPLVRQYAANFDVSLIVNTGDESQFGTAPELTDAYLKQLRSVTKVTPMIWLAGNHDSPATVAIMRTIPGVTVLGDKTASEDGGFVVSGQRVDAFGLTIGAIPDPRVYGAAGAYGADTADPLERSAVDTALADVPKDSTFDIMATHEPVAAQRIRHDLDGRVRQLNSGHTHKQNSDSDVQHNGVIDLVEGSTGAGGLKEVGIDVQRVPIEFSIESVAADCEFTKVVRFQINGSAPDSADVAPDAQDVTASTLYLKPQHTGAERTCDTTLGIGQPEPL